MPESKDAEIIRKTLSSFVECECAYGEAFKESCPRHGSIRALDRLFEQITTLKAQTEYLTECPSCGEGPSKTGFPRMDEDGCCACCGADCSIAGTVEAFKEREAQGIALEFYANSTNYDDFGIPKIPHEGHPGCKVPDCGRTARAALGRAV